MTTPPTSSAFEGPPGVGQVVGEDAGLQPETAGVDLGEGLLHVSEGEGHDQRREGLLRTDLGRARCVDQDGRSEEESVGADRR